MQNTLQRSSVIIHTSIILSLLMVAALVVTATTVTLLTNTSVASAQGTKKVQAKRLYGNGVKAYKSKKYEEAATLFLEAYSLDPRANLLYNIAIAHKDAGDYLKAQGFYRRYLEEMPEARNRGEVEAAIEDLQQLLAMQTASVNIDAPDDLNVFVDDEKTAKCTTPCTISLFPGEHSVTLRGEGIQEESKSLTAEAASVMTLSFEANPLNDGTQGPSGMLMFTTDIKDARLQLDGREIATLPMEIPIILEVGSYPAEILVHGVSRWKGAVSIQPNNVTNISVPLKGVASTGDGGASSQQLFAYTLLGVGIASMGAGAMFGLSAADSEEKLEGQLEREINPDQDLVDTGEMQALMANVLFAAGIVSISSGALLWVLDGESDKEGEATTLKLTPTPKGGVVQVQVHF